MLYLYSFVGLIVAAFAEILYLGQIGDFVYSAFPLVFSILFLLSYNGFNTLQLFISSFILSFILCIPLIGIDTWTDHQVEFVILFPFLVFMAHCFHYAYHRNHTLRMDYSILFEAAWNGLMILLFGVIFDFAINAFIIFLVWVIAKSASSHLYSFIVEGVAVPSFLGILFMFIGMGITHKHILSFNRLRFTLISCMYYFLPILLLGNITYFICFFNNPGEHPDVNISHLFELIILSLIFMNAYYQDGDRENQRLAWLDSVLRVYKVLLLAMLLTVSYYAYSYMSLNTNQLILLTLMLFSGWIYAQSAFLSDQRAQEEIEYSNKCIVFVFIIAIYLVNLPYLSVHFTLNKNSSSASLWSVNDLIKKKQYASGK